MLTLYIADKNLSSWSLRPWLLLKMLNIPFEERLERFEKDGSTFKKFQKFSPTGLVPCLQDGDITIWDSLAICEYIAESHSKAWPKDKAARAWARSATSEMHSGFLALRSQCPMNCEMQSPLTEIDSALAKDLERINQLWETGFYKFSGPFLAGDQFTIVDAFFAPIAIRISRYSLPVNQRCQDWIDLILSLPAMKEWLVGAKLEII
ncbi:glutathione S-transferase family protein [Ignatzschineria rhizosphaerae]|uniref:Glutathione S-transferase family protein n=1 Tax=Ignatzschineria rhizosphaerae TaxID=2923279 RepID=A0ABY3X5L8_9GAMM|nr:glutathione S-transferase family protein [Ignatzschineria rhizosphaerae]UNM96337.1 glutathione S-transferase family protein [Ignatzschineria rhizosphaerae]